MAKFSVLKLVCIALLCTFTISTIAVIAEPTESECRPHIEKALNTIKTDLKDPDSVEITVDDDDSSEVDDDIINVSTAHTTETGNADDNDDDTTDAAEQADDNDSKEDSDNAVDNDSTENDDGAEDVDGDSKEENAAADDDNDSAENKDEDNNSSEVNAAEEKSGENDQTDSKEADSKEADQADSKEDDQSDSKEGDQPDSKEADQADSKEDDQADSKEDKQSGEQSDDDDVQADQADNDDDADSKEAAADDKSAEADDDDDKADSKEDDKPDDNQSEEKADDDSTEGADATTDDADDVDSKENDADDKADSGEQDQADDNDSEEQTKTGTDADDGDSAEQKDTDDADGDSKEDKADTDADDDSKEDDTKELSRTEAEVNEIISKTYVVEELLLETEIPENLRDRSHIDEILRLNEASVAQQEALDKIAEKTLQDLKKIYENAIKPLETLYKYRDLSNRHFGDSEVFSKPLVLLMGPWSGGKSSMINYLTDNEHKDFSLKTGAEPSTPYFNILMHGETEQVLDGTQLAADWTFSGLQKFGQGLQERLRGLKLPSKLLKKVNIVEIPGILEVRKQVSRIFPFNDACQWFIDRADIIFLVYDPSKLDVGPETEAILDQLKGREYQTRILLNKADQVHPEELLRVQSALIWNISPLMSSQQPPIMYTVSMWSHPFEENTPTRLLLAQEKQLLRDLSQAIDHRIESKIASARRFAVRVRNHAKMVDCYLTTYYNHKTLFGNKQKISGEIVEHPQNYHIYEGLSTLTNISRYDLPDPDVYRGFFKLNPLYDFKKLSETCTYFRGCPINKLDVSIAYDLPELVNRYKRSVVQTLNTLELGGSSNDSITTNKR